MEGLAVGASGLGVRSHFASSAALRALDGGGRGERGRPAAFDSGSLAHFSPASGRAAYITGEQIERKLQEILARLGNRGTAKQEPEDPNSPEATSDRILAGVKGIFNAYRKQHKELSAEELVTSFMQQARSGVAKGYDTALSTLKDMGLFEQDGVAATAKKTVDLVHSKLDSFESFLRKEFGLGPVSVDEETAELTKDGLVKQAA